MKKIIASVGLLAAVGAFAVGMSSCGKHEKTIEVLVQTADHGWTGAVKSYAEEKVNEINKQGKYKVKLTACKDAKVEADKINELLTFKEDLHGIVMLPIDSTLKSTVTKIAAEEVPFVQFDRIIFDDAITNAASRVANVLGDNKGIGIKTAEEFIKKGIAKTDKVLLMPGDESSVPLLRTGGFKETLAAQEGWTMEDVDKMITTTPITKWSRETARDIFSKRTDITQYQWIFTHDSEIAMGILEELKANKVTQEVKDHFKNGGIKALASSSGLDEMYAVMEKQHVKNFIPEVIDESKTYLFDVTYDPAMIKVAIQSMVDHLDGKEVIKDNVIKVDVVNADNVSTTFKGKGFGSGAYRK